MSTARDRLEAVAAEYGVTAGGEGTLAVLPSDTFGVEELPDADPSTCTIVTEDGTPKLSIPVCRPYALRGGVHLIAPEHVAAMWQDLSPETLEREYQYRRENDLPIAPVLEAAVGGETA